MKILKKKRVIVLILLIVFMSIGAIGYIKVFRPTWIIYKYLTIGYDELSTDEWRVTKDYVQGETNSMFFPREEHEEEIILAAIERDKKFDVCPLGWISRDFESSGGKIYSRYPELMVREIEKDGTHARELIVQLTTLGPGTVEKYLDIENKIMTSRSNTLIPIMIFTRAKNLGWSDDKCEMVLEKFMARTDINHENKKKLKKLYLEKVINGKDFIVKQGG